MISAEDSRRTVRRADRYVVQPTLAIWGDFKEADGEAVPDGFSYISDTNDMWLGVDEIRTMLTELDL